MYIWKISVKDQTTADRFIENWREASKILQQYPGARGTRLHSVLDEPLTFLAIAEWESRAARDAMQSDVADNKSERAKAWNVFPKNDFYGEPVTVARVEEIDSVLPVN